VKGFLEWVGKWQGDISSETPMYLILYPIDYLFVHYGHYLFVLFFGDHLKLSIFDINREFDTNSTIN
jgi:hypothetical protein